MDRNEVKTVKQWRNFRLMTIRELAAKASVSTATIIRLENGTAKPNANTIKKLAVALDVGPGQIREGRTLMGIEEDSRG